MQKEPWHLIVLVPAHNERELLPRCLESIQRARRHLPSWVTTDVSVAVDDSDDGTLEVAKRILKTSGVIVQLHARCVGRARGLAARAALARYSGELATCWLANTDADCEVPDTWLLQHLELAQQGWSGVAGIVDVDSFAEHLPHVSRRFYETYRIGKDGTHPHVHGANLGVRADEYLRAGGWSDLLTAEDHDLWARLASSGAMLTSDARLVVLTSGRRLGRAPSGFAEALSSHNNV